MIVIDEKLNMLFNQALKESFHEVNQILIHEEPLGKRLYSQNFMSLFVARLKNILPQTYNLKHYIDKTPWGYNYMELSVSGMIPNKECVCHLWYTSNPNKFPRLANYREKYRQKNPSIQITFADPAFSSEEATFDDKIYLLFCFGYNEQLGLFGFFKQPDGKINAYIRESMNLLDQNNAIGVPEEIRETPNVLAIQVKETKKISAVNH